MPKTKTILHFITNTTNFVTDFSSLSYILLKIVAIKTVFAVVFFSEIANFKIICYRSVYVFYMKSDLTLYTFLT